MVKESVNLLELLRKQAAGGDLDFLREAVAVLAEAVMPRSPRGGRWLRRRSETPPHPAQWLATALGHTRRHHRVAYPEAPPGPFPALLEPRRRAERALSPGPAGVRRGRRPAADEYARQLRGHLQEPGLEDLAVHRRHSFLERPDGGPTATSGSSHPAGARGGPHRPGQRRGRHRLSTPTQARGAGRVDVGTALPRTRHRTQT